MILPHFFQQRAKPAISEHLKQFEHCFIHLLNAKIDSSLEE